MDFTAEGILSRLKGSLNNDANKMEGGFTMDNLQAVSEELAKYHCMLIKPLQEELQNRKDESCTSGNVNHYIKWAKEVTDSSGNKVVGNARAYGVRDGSGEVYVAIISPDAQTPDEETILLVTEYLQSKKPVGALPIVVPAQGIPVRISATVEIKDGYSIKDIRQEAINRISQYFIQNAFKKNVTALNYHRVGIIMSEIEGVVEIVDYTINEAEDIIEINFDEFFKLEELILYGC